MKRRGGQSVPYLSFKNNILTIPGFRFNPARPWNDTGSTTLLADGYNLADSSNVFAKIAQAHSNGSLCLDREMHALGRLATNSEATRIGLSLVECFTIPKEAGDCIVLVLLHPGLNQLGHYYPPSRINSLLFPWPGADAAAPLQDVPGAEGDTEMSDAGMTKRRANAGDDATDFESRADVPDGPAEEGTMDVEKAGIPRPENGVTNGVTPKRFDENIEENPESWDVMDLASFLEFAIAATLCLEVLHKAGLIHREIRPNAFHVNVHSQVVRFAHFGNRSVSLERLGGPSSLVIESGELPEHMQRRVKESICYLAPEQTGTAETVTEDHRTDLYSLGVMFWTLLVGKGRLPFEGTAMELLHAVVQKKPGIVSDIRPDIPDVVSRIVDKLMSKSPDSRYNSAVGLKNDLVECQKRLTLACASTDISTELIPNFEIGQHDMFLELTIPTTLFGRERELEIMRNVIRTAATAHSGATVSHSTLPFQHHRNSASLSIRGLGHFTGPHNPGGITSSSPSSSLFVGGSSLDSEVGSTNTGEYTPMEPQTAATVTGFNLNGGFKPTTVSPDPISEGGDLAQSHLHPQSDATMRHSGTESTHRRSSNITTQSTATTSSHLQAPLVPQPSGTTVFSTSTTGTPSASSIPSIATRPKPAKAHSVVVCGQAGVGKSSLILSNQASWRSHGLWGYAKLVKGESSPFTGLLSCLSTVLRQLMAIHYDLQQFVALLRGRLGQQIIDVPLLYHEAPELRDILALFNIQLIESNIALSSEELGARFQTLVETVFGVVADVKNTALFLDDLHFADQSTLDLVGLLANSRSRLLILASCRVDDQEVLNKVHHVFASKIRTTWIHLEPLTYNSLAAMVSTTLQRNKEDVAPLTRLVHRVSAGNPFSARNLLITVRRQGHIWYEWGVNVWQWNLEAIERSVHAQQLTSAPNDISFLVAHFRELPEDARKYLIWASLFGPTFKINDIANMMDWDDNSKLDDGEPDDLLSSQANSTSSNSSEQGDTEMPITPSNAYSKPSMRGLQHALAQGWVVQRARDMCSFTHDRYRQAASHMTELLPDLTVMRMCLRIAFTLMQESDRERRDVYRIAEYCRRCLPLIREHSKREEFVDCLVSAAEASAARGAHELALQAFVSARTLLGDGAWQDFQDRTLVLSLSISELYGSQGNYEASEQLIGEILSHATFSEDRSRALRLRSRNKFLQRDFEGAFRDTVSALAEVGIAVPETVSLKQADTMFDQVKAEILSIGFDQIAMMPRTTDSKIDLIVSLLNDAATNAFWGASPGFPDWIGMTTVKTALQHGLSPGTALGFFWCIAGAAERRQLYRFCADLGTLALGMAYNHGGVTEKCRAEVLYNAVVSGYTHDHLRTIVSRTDQAIKLARSAGDRIYEGFSQCYGLAARFYCSDHLNDLLSAAEEGVANIRVWTVNSDTNALAISILMTIRALAGNTIARNADTAFDTEKWKEAHYLHKLEESAGNHVLTMNWYNSFKVVGLFSLGFYSRAAELGFEVYSSRASYPSHRHVRFGLYFHSLALIQCLWSDSIPPNQRARYLKQIDLNQDYIRRWVSPSPVNNSAWHAIIEAELASYHGKPEAFRLYDNAVKLAMNNDWIMEEAWALYLEGSHFQRQGIEGLGSELQRRGIARHTSWGAYGIVQQLSRNMGTGGPSALDFKRPIFSSEVAVQTDVIPGEYPARDVFDDEITKGVIPEENEFNNLSASNLTDVLKWAQVIAGDINLTSSLQRLTEIAADNTNAQDATVAMRTDDGEFVVATSYSPPQPCIVFEQAKSVKKIPDPFKRSALQHCLNARERIFIADVSSEPRFAPEATQSVYRSIICIPMSNNRGEVYGALFLANRYSFSQTNLAVLTLLVQQASISIANALLFRSVQQATKANLQMIQNQRQALEEARKSKEDAMKATKIKSNFLASMSHELRTPFSSFYGLLDILSGTSLDSNQREIVATAKQSCELLLKIIDSILDYSKLEASALKLEPVPFLVEDVVADCVELLLPLAAKKLELSFNIKPDVPLRAIGDYSRIRQVLMNLLGNALKFTASGYVQTICEVDHSIPCSHGEVAVRWTVRDSGIGLSEADKRNLWQPFSQADNSSTRRFGGTGLGLSISLSLVKLMRGDIGVQSQFGVGSEFWFWVPVKAYESEETEKIEHELSLLKNRLLRPKPLRILISSPSTVTLALLNNILADFETSSVSSFEEALQWIHAAGAKSEKIDFIILDHFNAQRLEEIPVVLNSYPSLRNAKAIHLYTPTPIAQQPTWNTNWPRNTQDSDSSDQIGGAAGTDVDMAVASANGAVLKPALGVLGVGTSSSGGIIRTNKPPRRMRLIQLLASLKDVGKASGTNGTSQISTALSNLEAAKSLLGSATVLIAEDNPIANQLLIRQLQRYKLTVVSTTNGELAVKEWEKRGPGFFSFALFDHHMPVCDGVEAVKRVRALEMRRKLSPALPVIALSADCQESTKELCLSAGMNGFLTKPLRPGDIPNLLRTYGTPANSENNRTISS